MPVSMNQELELINHLGIDLGNTAEEILTRLQKQDYETGQDNHANHSAGIRQSLRA